LRPLASALFAGVVALSTVVVASPQAQANPPSRDAAAAEILFREGRAHARARDYAGACPRFEESLRLDPAPGTLLNLADCEEHLGRLASAWEHYTRLTSVIAESDDRFTIAKMHAAAIAPHLARLTVELARGADADGSARVSRDGVELRGASIGASLPVDPGPHTIEVDANGRTSRRTTIVIARGESRVFVADVGPPAPRSSHAATLVTAGWIFAGAGAALVGSGAYIASGDPSSSDAGVLIGAGLVAAVVSVVAFVTAGDSR
jgi:hypothetical protein